jgi:predicted transcriptional regulator
VKAPRTVQEGDIISPSPNERIAHAMEYIAAHIGRIDRKLEKIIERLDGLKVLGRDQK